MLGAGILLGSLVRGNVRGHHHHPIEPELVVGVARDRQVPEVRRVERAAEDADGSRFPGPQRLLMVRGGPVAMSGLLNRGRARPPR